MNDYKHDIEKYLSGKLTPAEMHALEKKSLTDPFLADALEGSESINPQDFSVDLKKIQDALNDRIETKQRTISPWTWTFRIAAGLIVLVISTYIIFSITRNNEQPSDLALNNTEQASKPQNQQPSARSNKIVTEKEQEPKTQAEENKIIEKPTISEQPKTYSDHTNAKPESRINDLAYQEEESVITDRQAEEEITSEPSYLDSIVMQPTETFSKSSPNVASSSDLPKRKQQISASSGMNADKKIESVKTIKGKVTDAEDGSALPGVNVTVKNTNVGTVTDAEGNFEIPAADPNAELVFSFIGLQNVEVPATGDNSLDVKMSADFSELSEIVVVGYAPVEPGVIKEPKPITYYLAEPKGGRKAYKNYLAQNVRYPQQAIENKIEGKVSVQFVVETSGLLNEFKVLKSVGYGCDEEVIRLIKAGPKWTPSKRDDVPLKAKVKVRLRFTLPK